MTMRKLMMISVLATTALFAHCDTLDGPVVEAARRAMASGDVNLVLRWVQPDQEPAIREAFVRTMRVRTLDLSAAELADTWFFETLVRLHRAGEGEPYEGLKPAGTGVSTMLLTADKAIATGDLQMLEKTLTVGLQRQLQQRFSRVMSLKNRPPANVHAGREYVAAYVDFIHFAERADQTINIVRERESHVH